MRRTEVVFLLCVFAFAALFVTRSVTHTIPLLPGGPSPGAAAIGAAGQPRDVDMPRLKRLLDLRETYAATLEEPAATTYRAELHRVARKRFPRFTGLLEE